MPLGAEKSDKGAECGEILVAPARTSSEVLAEGLLAMNILRVPKVPTTPASTRALRKRRRSTQGARLELTLEMPAQRPPVESVEHKDEAQEPERGVAEIDFYI